MYNSTNTYNTMCKTEDILTYREGDRERKLKMKKTKKQEEKFGNIFRLNKSITRILYLINQTFYYKIK